MTGRPIPLDLTATRYLARHLLRGERILWAGRPKQGLLLGAQDLLIIPLGLLFVTVGSVTVLRELHRPLSPDWVGGLIAICAGLLAVVGRHVLDGMLRARTYYAVTEKRILILREGLFPSLLGIDRANLTHVELLQAGARGTPRGTIRFGPAQTDEWNMHGSWVAAFDPTPQFLGIADPAEVFALIQRNRPGARAA